MRPRLLRQHLLLAALCLGLLASLPPVLGLTGKALAREQCPRAALLTAVAPPPTQCLAPPLTPTQIGILVLCHARPRVLEGSLRSLLAARGVRSAQVVAVQDGTREVVAQVVHATGIALIQRERDELPDDAWRSGIRMRKHNTTAARIARHYRFALDAAFAHFPAAEALVVAEDDLEHSPDVLDLFEAVLPVVRTDPSLWSASAWNDNGFAAHARRPERLLRTAHFPGLCWLALRQEWTTLRESWPETHWDWALRSPELTQGREVAYPEVPRVKHVGESGSFVDAALHARYFAGIRAHDDAGFRWGAEHAEAARLERYDAALARLLLHGAVHVRQGCELNGALRWLPGATLVAWHESNPDPKFAASFKPLAARLGIWHQLGRGSREGVHELYWGKARLILVNVFDPERARRPPRKRAVWFHAPRRQARWAALRPPAARIFRSGRELAEEMEEGARGC